MRRVVVTGLGIVSPLGVGTETNWSRIIRSQSGIVPLGEGRDIFPSKVAGLVPQGARAEGRFELTEWVAPRDTRRMDTFMGYGIAAADLALEDAAWKPSEQLDCERTGVLMGSGIGGLGMIEDAANIVRTRGPGKLSPFFIPAVLINLVSGRISIRHGLQGPNSAVVTACSTGTHAIGDAARMIALDDADVMVAGGAESTVGPLGIESFCALRALSTKYNDAPQTASRPWDKGRDGFVMGEGAGALVLEELEHAKRRGATIRAEVVGYGMSGDAHHITAPPESGRGAQLAMEAAMRRAKINPDQVDYINAHGTSTPTGDLVELRAMRAAFGEALKGISISSTKSAVGHLLGAAGAVEAIFTILAMQNGIAPPTLNLNDPEGEAEGLDLVPLTPRERPIRVALSNSFGFGGTNASLVFAAAP